MDSNDEAICIIEITKVDIVPFKDVSADHAFKEGEGDKTLEWWRKAHIDFFKTYFEEFGLMFSEDSRIVLEEFQVVYPKEINE